MQVQGLLALDRGKAAWPFLQKLVEIAPGAAEGWILLGRAQAAAGKVAAAEAAWSNAEKLRPNDPALATERALAALAKGKVDVAAALLARIKGSGRRGAEAHYQLAESLRPGHVAAVELPIGKRR